MLDVILHIEINSDVSSHTGRPALSNFGFSNLYYGESSDYLSHPGPASKNGPTVL